MLDTTKASLTIILQGRVMVSKEESLINSDSCYIETVSVYDTKTKKYWHYKVPIRKTVPASQVINISYSCYQQYLQTPPDFKKYPKHIWAQMSKRERFKANAEYTAEALGGKLLEFTIYED
jgi:hypothetical protein